MLKLFIAVCLSPNIAVLTRRLGQDMLTRIDHSKHLRVIDGRDITNGEYSFVVILFLIGKSKNTIKRCCTASMIAKNWILTASHCVDYDETFYIWYGNYTTSPLESNLYSLVQEIYKHPAYRSLNLNDFSLVADNDISLLRIRDIKMSRYGKICSVDHTTMIGLPVTYVGGGITNKLGDDQLRPLQVGTAAIITCDMEFKDLTRYLLCVTPKCSEKLRGSDSGDSGGPLLYDGNIIGVLSFGQSNDQIVSEGYTPVSPYIDWIHQVTHSKD